MRKSKCRVNARKKRGLVIMGNDDRAELVLEPVPRVVLAPFALNVGEVVGPEVVVFVNGDDPESS